ncbi:MAG: hypothetical protein MN733_38975 [Nitrososphaera sp.]|nr:hypothetical protein [Nitrososphaera sp.]
MSTLKYGDYVLNQSEVDPDVLHVSLVVPGGEYYGGIARLSKQGDLETMVGTLKEAYERLSDARFIKKTEEKINDTTTI